MTDEPAAEWVNVEDLTPWAANPRENESAVAEVVKSIERFGFGAPLLARKENGEIIAGHTRIRAALDLGLDRVPVRYLDLSESEAHALALADNKLAEIAEWSDGLADVLAALEAAGVDLDGLGWSADALAAISAPEITVAPGDGVPDLPDEAVSVPGDVYELGPHRLICGDSTDPEVWTALLQGDVIQVVWTDPPYGVSYVGGTKDAMTIMNDALKPEELRALLAGALGLCLKHCKPGAAWYVAAPDGRPFLEFAIVLADLDVWRWTLQWVKDRFVLGRADYHHRHEPVFYGWKPGAAHYFVDDRTLDTVFEIARPKVNAIHPTMKPIALVTEHLENSAKTGWIVGEPFGGSGTTLMAAAGLGMRARVIELDPKYCDAIRIRYTKWAVGNDMDPGPGALHE